MSKPTGESYVSDILRPFSALGLVLGLSRRAYMFAGLELPEERRSKAQERQGVLRRRQPPQRHFRDQPRGRQRPGPDLPGAANSRSVGFRLIPDAKGAGGCCPIPFFRISCSSQG